jgi:hypothetical protein
VYAIRPNSRQWLDHNNVLDQQHNERPGPLLYAIRPNGWQRLYDDDLPGTRCNDERSRGDVYGSRCECGQ